MSLSIETSTLTLAFINTSNNVSQLENNIRDVSNNIKRINQTFDNLLSQLNIEFTDVSGYTQQIIDLSNQLSLLDNN
tara:strand:- start:416 stop:646 length:231 start_codon:yes stop_codon:yes gene_type:complete